MLVGVVGVGFFRFWFLVGGVQYEDWRTVQYDGWQARDELELNPVEAWWRWSD